MTEAEAHQSALLQWLPSMTWLRPSEIYRRFGLPRGITYRQVDGDLRALVKTGKAEREQWDGWRWHYRAVASTP